MQQLVVCKHTIYASYTQPSSQNPQLSTNSLLLFTHNSLLSTQNSLLSTHYPLPSTHYSLLTTHYPLLSTNYPLLSALYYLLSSLCSLFSSLFSLLTALFSLLSSHCYLLIAIFYLLTAHCSLLPAFDFLLRPKAFAFIPMGEGSRTSDGFTRYDLGGGADLGFEVDLSTVWPNPISLGYTAGLEGGMTTNPVQSNDPKNLLIYSIGGSAGLYFFPFSRLFLRVDGAAGVYRGSIGDLLSPVGFYWRGGGEIGFRFTPSFLLAANSGWRQYEDSRTGFQPVNSGLYAGLTAQITFETGGSSSRSGAEAVLEQTEPVYPVFMQIYQSNPAGTIVIRNRENAEIRNVRVSFRAANYTSSEFFCGSISVLPRGKSVDVPLLADFSPAVLRFTDNSRILGEVVIRYNFLGKEREAISAVTLSAYSRNTVTEDDTAALAAFISPTAPEILEFSKYVIGIARSKRRMGHSQNMQYAVWLYEGLRALGVRIGDAHIRENEAQFPAETLIFGRGSSRDIALLFAAAMESVGISCALMKVGTDYIVAVDLSINQTAAETLFNNKDRILIINNNCWLPIAMSSFDYGFMPSWIRGITTINQAFERGETVNIHMTSDAWAVYPPAPLPGMGIRAVLENSDALLAEANAVVDQYVTQEILPIIWLVEAQIARNPTAALYNRLGILLVRAGRIREAKTNYERAANMGSIPAMTNRGSLALNERDYNTAELWFRRALDLDRTNAVALRGLERVEGRR